MTRVLAAISLFVLFLVPVSAVRAQDHGDAVDCTSRNYAYTRCEVPWHDARLVRQLSDTQCARGRNWGIDRRGLWVNGGCGGRFVEAGRGRDRDYGDRDRGGRDDRGDRGDGGGWQPDQSWNQRFSVTCESQDGRDRFCQVDVGGGGRAYLERQLSNTACVEGQSWGWNRAGVWVTQGCRGVFSVDRRWR